MKKFIYLFLALLTFSFYSCNENPPENPSEPSNPSNPSEPTDPSDPPVGSGSIKAVKAVYTLSYKGGICDTLSYVIYQYEGSVLSKVFIRKYDKSITEYIIKNFGKSSMTVEGGGVLYSQFVYTSDGKYVAKFAKSSSAGSWIYDVTYENGKRLSVSQSEGDNVLFSELLKIEGDNYVKADYIRPESSLKYSLLYSSELNTMNLRSYWTMGCIVPPSLEYAAMLLTGLFGEPSKNLVSEASSEENINYISHRFDSERAIWYDRVDNVNPNDSNVVETHYYRSL